MAKRNASDLRAHLSMFEPSYPIQKGYIARLLLVNTAPEVIRTVKAIVETAEPSKPINDGSLVRSVYHFKKLVFGKKYNLTRQWPSFIRLFVQKFPITFRSLPSSPTSSNPAQPSTLSSEKTRPTSESLPQTTPSQPLQTCPPSVSASQSLPSPKTLRRDCASCVAKQRTNINMMHENQRLSRQIKELKKAGSYPMKRINQNIKRKVHTVVIWKARNTALNKESVGTKKLQESLQVSQQKLESLQASQQKLQKSLQASHQKLESLESYIKRLHKENYNLTEKLKRVRKTTEKASLEHENEIFREEAQSESQSIKEQMHPSVQELQEEALHLQS